MAKPKHPLLSLGAVGTIANSITFEPRPGMYIARKKPTQPYSFSLAQAYQRWLYQDYIYRWHQLTEAQQETYNRLGSPHRLSGFAYYMSQQLTLKPDMLCWWKLDSQHAGKALDETPNNYDGTIFGAVLAPGNIGRSYYFDGINNRVTSPLNGDAYSTGFLSLELRVRSNNPAAFEDIAGWQSSPLWADARFLLYQRNSTLRVAVGDGVNSFFAKIIGPTSTNWQTILLILYGHEILAYIKGAFAAYFNAPFTPDLSGVDFRVGGGIRGAIYYWDGWADNIITYPAILPLGLIQMHAERSYPQ